jgi:hypothetical protein
VQASEIKIDADCLQRRSKLCRVGSRTVAMMDMDGLSYAALKSENEAR